MSAQPSTRSLASLRRCMDTQLLAVPLLVRDQDLGSFRWASRETWPCKARNLCGEGHDQRSHAIAGAVGAGKGLKPSALIALQTY